MLFVRAEDVVPNPGGDAETQVVGLKMARHVIPARFYEIPVLARSPDLRGV